MKLCRLCRVSLVFLARSPLYEKPDDPYTGCTGRQGSARLVVPTFLITASGKTVISMNGWANKKAAALTAAGISRPKDTTPTALGSGSRARR